MDSSFGANNASIFAGQEDILFWVLVALTVVFTLIVGVMILILSLRYRRGTKVDRSHPVTTDHRLEITWSVIPLLLGIGVFIWGAKLFEEVRVPPANCEEVLVIGKQWMWHLQHMNGVRENNELHIPLGKPVKLTMISQDVVHDFFVPAFRLHQDVEPGHYTQEWFVPNKVGKYHFFCAQYCGTNHSQMTGYVYVMKPADYAVWLSNGGVGPQNQGEQAILTPEQRGAQLYDELACANCHGPVDTPRGPSLVGIYGRKRFLEKGGPVVADDEYLRESIVNPYAKIVKGYGPTMPIYNLGSANGDLSEEKLHNLIAFIKSMGTPSAKTPPASGSNVRGGYKMTPGNRERQEGIPSGQ